MKPFLLSFPIDFVGSGSWSPLSQAILDWIISPTFRIVRKSIRLIPRGIAQDSLCGYWEHADQFVGPALDRRGVWQLVEG